MRSKIIGRTKVNMRSDIETRMKVKTKSKIKTRSMVNMRPKEAPSERMTLKRKPQGQLALPLRMMGRMTPW